MMASQKKRIPASNVVYNLRALTTKPLKDDVQGLLTNLLDP